MTEADPATVSDHVKSGPGVPVSIIIAAYNAEETLAETLDSLVAQTVPDWEAMVVDDGSTDTTAQIARRYADRDTRIRVIEADHGGEGAARNRGIAEAGYQWLLFLDSDDWLAPDAVEKLTGAVDEEVDAVYGAWARVARDGSLVPESFRVEPDAMFAATARFCPFAIHSCLVRRARVEEVHGFEPALQVGSDWDLWQRIARTGAVFVPIPEVVAFYRMRTRSMVSHVQTLLANGLRLIALGHGQDPRVVEPHPEYADGEPRAGLPLALFSYVCWPAGMLLGRGEDARELLNEMLNEAAPELTGVAVANSIFRSAMLPGARRPDEWVTMWPRIESCLDAFLASLETRTAADGLARRARRELERLVVRNATQLPLTIGSTHATRVDAAEPIRDVSVPRAVERVSFVVAAEGMQLGTLDLPVFNELLPRDDLADAIAARFAWPLLGRFFALSVYRTLEWRHDSALAGGRSIWRGNVCLSSGDATNSPDSEAAVHDRIGWTVFLQELWGYRDWPIERFYDPTSSESQPGEPLRVSTSEFAVEASSAIPDLEIDASGVNLMLTVGGTAVVQVQTDRNSRRLSAAEIRASVTSAAGFELCIAAVREALVGAPLSGRESLRERLAAKAERRNAGRI